MWTLSGFADEIDPDFQVQAEVARDLDLDFIEVRSAWDIGVLDLTDAQLASAKDILTDASLGVSSIGAPTGKILIDDVFEPHLDKMHRAIEVAHYLRSPYLRIFSCFVRPDLGTEQVREEVLRRLRALADIA